MENRNEQKDDKKEKVSTGIAGTDISGDARDHRTVSAKTARKLTTSTRPALIARDFAGRVNRRSCGPSSSVCSKTVIN